MTVATSDVRFDERIDRRASNSMKRGGAQSLLSPEEAAAGPLPMWVADMDFRAPRPEIDALLAAAEGHGYMRVNLGCPRATVDEAIARLTAALSPLRGSGR